MKKEIRYDTAGVSNRDFAMPVEVETTDAPQQATGEQQHAPTVTDALRPFADLLDGDLSSIGGGTLIAPSLKVQLIKDAKAALAREQPRGLARLDAQGLAELRAVIFHVIDEGWKCSDGCDLRHAWRFMSADTPGTLEDEEYDTRMRIRFNDLIAEAIVQRAAPATTATATGASRAKGER